MTRALDDVYLEIEGAQWCLLDGEIVEGPEVAAVLLRACWSGASDGPPRKRRLRVDAQGHVRLVQVTDFGWRLDRDGRPLHIPPEAGPPTGPEGASVVTVDVDAPQRATGRWLVGRRVKDGVSLHSRLPRPEDFEEARVLDVANGRIVRVHEWAAFRRRRARLWVGAMLGLCLLGLGLLALGLLGLPSTCTSSHVGGG